jgi:negative regulator of sigma E activity
MEAHLEKVARAIANTPEANGEWEENHFIRPSLRYDEAIAFAKAAIACIADGKLDEEALEKAYDAFAKTGAGAFAVQPIQNAIRAYLTALKDS